MSDPVVGAIVAGVLWFVLGGMLEVIIYLVGFAVAAAFMEKKPGVSGGAILSAWVLGVSWAVFVLIQVIIQVVRLIQLLTGAAV